MAELSDNGVARFSELRERFHALLALDEAARLPALESLRAGDPALADELGGLLALFDERDLAASPPATPSQVGPFRILRRLGRGGMGEVFLAERIEASFEQRVALKLIAQRGLRGELAQRFIRERQILARLSHPNIAHLIDGGFDDDGTPWLAMEYVDGLPLGRWVASRRPGLVERVWLVRQVALAVAFAHGQLVVHRDLKPANILVGADDVPKLLDFGIAKLLDDTVADDTRTGLRALTPRYAAPEQLAGDRVTTATDVHALGVLLHELVAERSPWPEAALGRQGWLQAIIHAPPAALLHGEVGWTTAERRRIGGDLQRIASKALAKDPANRYAGAAALADDLDDWLVDRPLRSGIGSRREQTRQFLRRHRWPLLLVASVLVALSAGLLLALREAVRAERQTVIAEANLDAMLGVLGAAVPQDFQARETPAGEFLLRAAVQLQANHADNPVLIRRALGEIGLGLINLGEGTRAEALLQAAIAASQRNGDDAARQLGIYKLLVFSQDDPDAQDRVVQTAQRIAELAVRPTTPPGVAIDALASAAGVLSRQGRFDDAEWLFNLADRRLDGDAAVSPGQAENFWRQRGWSAWRAWRLDAASAHLHHAQAVVDGQPSAFSALRRAELQQLLADVEVARSNDQAAAVYVDAATPVFEGEYPSGHPERAYIGLNRAAVAMAQGRVDAARSDAEQAVATLSAIGGEAAGRHRDGLARGYWLIAEAAAARGHCGDARQAVTRATAAMSGNVLRLPRGEAQAKANMDAVQRYCGQASLR